jgi:hypothetical protein
MRRFFERWQISSVLLAVLLVLSSLNSVAAFAWHPVDGAGLSLCAGAGHTEQQSQACSNTEVLRRGMTAVIGQQHLAKLHSFGKKIGKRKHKSLRKQWLYHAVCLPSCRFSRPSQIASARRLTRPLIFCFVGSGSPLTPRAPPVSS